MKYVLEIYPPGGSGRDVAHTITSDAPFLPISRGDLLNPQLWPEHASSVLDDVRAQFRHGVVLRVTGVEHMISEADGRPMTHKVCIFTKAEENIAGSRP